MDQSTLETRLADLNLPAIRYLDRTDSTNNEASRWISAGARDSALVVADEQTAGRGRGDRRWTTVPGSGLAFSLIIFPVHHGPFIVPRRTVIGALAVKDALHNLYGLCAQIKWPNDVLLNHKKVAGILTENYWSGDDLTAVILGFGINVTPASVDPAALPVHRFAFPATCVEDALGRPVDRIELIHAVLQEYFAWRPRISSPEFLRQWEANLAFLGEWVQVTPGESFGKDGLPVSLEKDPTLIGEGKVLGLAPDGALKLLTRSGETVTAQFGEVRLRPKN
jgi:BirA family biotin operon repressor/biotin-[acetyl-CoA-carboxylase] ligase